MTKMLYFVVISLKANLFFFRQNVTIFFKSYHSSFTSHPKKVCCLPLFKSKKINLRICYETRFWKLPTNLSNDFERESFKFQISSDQQFTKTPNIICNFFLETTQFFILCLFFVEKFYLFSKSVIPSPKTHKLDEFILQGNELRKIFFEILFKDTTITGL